MAVTDRLHPWQPRILFLGVLAILVLVGVIQYQWFSRSAAVEIEGTIHGLEFSLRQAVIREFQRYAPVVAELEALAAQKEAGVEGSRAVLDRLMAAYGPRGTVPGLLSWVGLAGPGLKDYQRSEAPGSWTSAPFPGASWAYEARGLAVPEGAERQNVLVVRSGPSPRAPVVLVGLDVQRFFQGYVFSALSELFPGAVLSWAESTRDPPPPGGFDPGTYAFNPITALVAGASLPPTLEVGIPRFIDLGGRNLSAPGTPDATKPPQFRVFSTWTVKVTLPKDAPVLGIEGQLAWNWLGGTLLLVVLALAFALVLGQSARVAALRRQEREFVASVSHELRTPLTVIRSAADNFSQGIVPAARQGQYGKLILDQSLRLGRMVEQMLSFAQAEAAPPAPVQAELRFAPWLAELKPALEALAAERQVHLVWDVAGVPASGLTDPEALRLVLENLVVNALNHAYPAPAPDQGARTIRVTLRHLVPDRLELTVDDDGRGISPKEAKKVFEPFYRDQVSRDNQEKGSGLGLFLAQKQARRLGGLLRLESPWRRLDGTRRPGCRFTLTVPFQPQNEEVDHGR